jgi:hypothetical protein
MKKNTSSRPMVYTLNINDFQDDEQIIDVIRAILKMHKSNMFKNSNGNYQVDFPQMILRIETIDEDLLEP